jgi:hypothetical protein
VPAEAGDGHVGVEPDQARARVEHQMQQRDVAVAEDRREDVVEFVGRRANELAERSHFSSAAQLVLGQLELKFQGYSVIGHVDRRSW